MTTSLMLYAANLALIILGLILKRTKQDHIGGILIWIAVASLVTESIVVNRIDWISIAFIYGLPLVILGFKLKAEGAQKKV